MIFSEICLHRSGVGTVTVDTLGSPNTTPCDIAAAGTTNLTINCKSVSPTCSGNNWIGIRAVLTPTIKGTLLMPELKNGFTVEKS